MRHCVRIAVLAILIAVLAVTAQMDVRSEETKPGDSRQSILADHNSGAKQLDRSIRIQRVMVPEDRPEDWPRSANQHYLPMIAEEFERRLAIVNGQSAPGSEPSKAQLTEAQYTAELDGEHLIGRAAWKFEQKQNQPAVVFLQGCQLAIADPGWIAAPEESNGSANARTAIVGNDQLGRLAAVVDRAGTIACRWSARAATVQQDDAEFELMLPTCPRSTLEIELPADRVLSVDSGIVSLLSGAKDSTLQTWRVELGGESRVILHCGKRLSHAAATVRVRQKLTYEYSQRGLDLTAELTLDAVAGPVRQLKIDVDSPLVVVGAMLDAKPVRVNTTSTAAGNHQFAVELAEPLKDFGHVLTVTAVGPAETSKPQRLPFVHVAASNWQQTVATLKIKSPLILGDLDLKDCRQTSRQVDSNEDEETCDLQFFKSDPEVELVLQGRQEKVTAQSGTSVTLRANEGLARCETKFGALRGECFNLEADIAPQWLIDNVESTPADLIADWSQQAPRGRPAKLRIQLTRSIGPDRPITLSVTGRRRRAPWGDTLRAADLAMLTFNNVETTRRLIEVQALEPYQLQLRGDETIHRLQLDKLTPEDANLLGQNAPGIILVDDEQSRSLEVTLGAKSTQFDADIRYEVAVSNDRLSEAYHLAINPKGREISKLTVRFSQPRSDRLVWAIDGEQAGAVIGRRPNDDAASLHSAGGDVWEVTLPSPHSTPFVLSATRRMAFQTETALALASVVGADSQQGICEISFSGAVQPEVRTTRRIKALPIDLSPSNRNDVALAAFRYDPDEDPSTSADPPLVLVPGGQLFQNASIWIWRQHLQSAYRPGNSEHFLKCEVESIGPHQVQFTVPPGAKLLGAWVDDRSILDEIDLDRGIWVVDLSAAARLTSISLQWTQPSTASQTIAKQIAPWPQCNVTTLLRDWTVNLPPGNQLLDATMAGSNRVQVPWTKRLFGPLAQANLSVDCAVPLKALVTNGEQQRSAGMDALDVGLSLGVDQSAASGWTTYRFDGLDDSPSEIYFADSQVIIAWAWATFVCVAGLRLWFRKTSLPFDLLCFGILTSVAIAAPALISMLTAAAWLGLATGRLLSWLFGSRQPHAESGKPKLGRNEVSRTIALVIPISILLAMACALVQAEEDPVAGANAQSPVQRVLIPIDANGRPSGRFYYLPESLHSALVRRTPDFAIEPPKYLITSAIYRSLALARDLPMASGSYPWHAEFEIESLVDGAAIRLPLGQDGTVLPADSAILDGQAARLRPADQERYIDIELRGRHRLELTFLPVPKSGGFNFAVPVVAAAKVESSPTAERATFLGPANRVVIAPPGLQPSTHEAEQVEFNVDELNWMQINSAGITVATRLKLDVLTSRLSHFDLKVDPRLVPEIAADDTNVARIEPLGFGGSVLRIEMKRPVSGKSTIDLKFALKDNSAIGQFDRPQLEVLSAKNKSEYWAATIESGLNSELQREESETIAVQRFLGLWGKALQKPQFAWTVTPKHPQFTVTTRPAQNQVFADYRIALLTGQQDASVRANVTVTSEEPVFQYRIALPPQLDIAQLSVEAENTEIPIRWAHSRPELLTVFFESSSHGEITLAVHGRLPVPPNGKFAAPLLHIDGTVTKRYELDLLRRPDAMVSLANPSNARSVPEAEWPALLSDAENDGLIEPGPSRPKPAAILRADGDLPPPTVIVGATLSN